MGRDAISRTEHDGVTGHELACRDAHLDPVADGMPDRRCHFAQGLERALGAELLDDAEKDRDQDDHGDHHGLERVPEQPRNEGCDDQDEHQDVLELGREGAPRGALRERLQLVRPMDGQPAARLLGTQAIVLCRALVRRPAWLSRYSNRSPCATCGPGRPGACQSRSAWSVAGVVRSKSLNLSAQGNVGFTAGGPHPVGHEQVFMTVRVRRSPVRVVIHDQWWCGLRATACPVCMPICLLASRSNQ